MRAILFACLGLAACQPNFESIDDACPKKIGGENGSDQEVIDVFHRVTCYRRFAGIKPATIDDRISDAAYAHSLYIQQNGPESNPIVEDSQKPSFSGVDPLERMVAQGYELTGTNYGASYGFWEGAFINDPSFEPADIADGWMWGQYTRQGVLQPGWLDAGYGSNDDYAVLTILYDFPAPEAVNKPVVWPADGQTEVPTTWAYEYDDGLLPLFEVVGYPITFTVGSDDSRSSSVGVNPYDLVAYDAMLEGPDGEVETVLLTPDSATYAFPYSVAIIPKEPLAGDTTYTATARLKWNSRESAEEFTTTFTTASAADARRRIPTPVQVTWRSPGGVVHTWAP